MKAIVISKKGVKFKEVEDPKIKHPNNTIIRVIATGLCGSDLQNIAKIKYNEEKIMGHEIVGEVETLGKNNKKIKRGDIVVVSPIIGCKRCKMCKIGYIQHCKNSKMIGKNIDGGFAERVLIPDYNNLYVVPKSKFSYKFVLADPLSVCLHALEILPNLKNKTLGIIGNGTIGELFCQVAKYKKVKKVTIFGKETVNYDKCKDFFDITIECVGRDNPNTVNNAIDITKVRGTILVLGVFKEGYILPLNARELFIKEITLLGSNSYSLTPKKDDFKEAINLLLNEKIKTGKIITNILKLDQFNEGLKLSKNKEMSKSKKVIFCLNDYRKI